MGKKKITRKLETVFLGDEINEYLESLTLTEKKTRQASTKAGKAAMELLGHWQKIAPQRLLEHTDNVVFSKEANKKEILVFVDSAAFATELSMDKELYRISMQQALNKEVSDIKFLVSRKTAFRKKSQQKR